MIAISTTKLQWWRRFAIVSRSCNCTTAASVTYNFGSSSNTKSAHARRRRKCPQLASIPSVHPPSVVFGSISFSSSSSSSAAAASSPRSDQNWHSSGIQALIPPQQHNYYWNSNLILSTTTRTQFPQQARGCRFFSKKSRSRQKSNIPNNPMILPRRETDKDVETKQALPDQKKEKALGQMQAKVHEAYRQGSYRAGLKHAQALLKAAQAHFGEKHPVVAAAHNDVGLFAKLLGDFDLARLSYKHALKLYKKSVGTDHANYATQLHNLASLNRTQIHLDTMLKATDRLTLMEEAIKVSQQAYQIRLDERGPDHPHTVSSRSAWGAALAMQILQHYKETGTNRYRHVNHTPATAATTEAEWDAAEEHLRHALKTAIENPRGPSLKQQQEAEASSKTKTKTALTAEKLAALLKCEIQTLSAASAAQNLAVFLKARATTIERNEEKKKLKTQTEEEESDDTTAQATIKGDETTSSTALAKKENSAELLEEEANKTADGADEKKTGEGKSNATIPSKEMNDSDAEGQVVVEDEISIVSTSATTETSPSSSSSSSSLSTNATANDQEMEDDDNNANRRVDAMFKEAQSLYQDVLTVRQELLSSKHPDVYATKHSLAELLQAMGKEADANAVRQEILDTYDPQSTSNPKKAATKSTTTSPPPTAATKTQESSTLAASSGADENEMSGCTEDKETDEDMKGDDKGSSSKGANSTATVSPDL